MDIQKQRMVTQRSTFVQILLGLIVNFSSLSPSMSLGFSAVALPYLLDASNPHRLTEHEASWFASIATVAAPLGCFLSGPISDRFGRKPAIQSVNVFCLLGWAAIAFAYYSPSHQYRLLLVGRFFTGFSTGLSSMPATVYMAEISTAKLRGMLITWNALCFSLGVVVIYILGWILTSNWGIIAVLSAALPCANLFMVMGYMVESPSWLITKNRHEDAKASLLRLFNSKSHPLEIREEIETLTGDTRNTKIDHQLKWRYFAEPAIYRPFVLMSTFFVFQHVSGTFVIVFYAIDIVNEAQISIDPYLAIVLIAATRSIASVVVSIASRRFGRRPLTITSGVGMTLCMVLLSAYLACIKQKIIAHLDWLPLTLLMAYFFTATLGFLTIPFAMSAEVFPPTIRGLATGLVSSVGYFCCFIMVKIYPDMLNVMGIYPLFIFYAAMSAVGTIFILLCLPETKGKTLSEIENCFSTNGVHKTGTELKNVALT